MGLCVWLWYWHGHGGRAAGLARSENPNDRLEAIGELRGKSGSLALRTLTALSHDPDVRVARQAVQAVGARPGQDARSALVRILKEASRGGVRGEALAALGNYPDTDPQPLIDVAGDPAKDPEERIGALKAIARLGSPQALAVVLKALSDDDWRVRATAHQAVPRLVGVTGLFDPRGPKAKRDQQVADLLDFLRKRKLLPAGVEGR